MDTITYSKAALNKCLELSEHINGLGLGISSKRAACEIFDCLIKSTADLGACLTSVDYIPTKNERLNVVFDAMKHVSKVIYLLNVANNGCLFLDQDLSAPISCAVKISELLNSVLAECLNSMARPQPPVTVQEEPKPEAEEETVADEDEADGFNEPYEG